MEDKTYSKKDTTLDKIIKSSIKLFSQRWYSSVSIAEICRKAKISNGLFYHYFSNKEELIKHILDKTVNEIENILQNINGKDLNEKISQLIILLSEYTMKNRNLILVFREGQYRYFEYERKLVQIYNGVLKKIFNKNIPLALYLFIFGGLRWICIRKSLYDCQISLDVAKEIILNGIYNEFDFDIEKIISLPIKFPDFSYPFDSKQKLIEAGKSLFGEFEYNEVNIHHITEKANLAIGTFYKHFSSKESFFEILVESSGKQIRHFINENIGENFNSLERELRGIFLFLNYLKFDRNCYNIVREAEFVKPEKAKDYYDRFIKGYKKNKFYSIENEKNTRIPLYSNTVIEFLLGISHYFGIEYIFDNQNIDLVNILNQLALLLKKGLGGFNL